MTIRSMRLAYPVRLETEEGGSVLASFPDVAEALTEGVMEREALAEAKNYLIVALGGYIEGCRDIPRPSSGRGRLLDLDHRSHIGQAEAALYVLGQRLVVAHGPRRNAPRSGAFACPASIMVSGRGKQSSNAKTPTR